MISPDFSFKVFLTACVVTAPIFLLGLYLQIKIIKTVKSERTITWELHICHSIIMIVHYSFLLAFETVAYLVPSISDYTGESFCYVAVFLRGYGIFSIGLHSLMICVYKYMIIVHDAASRMFGKERLKKAILGIYLLNPILTSVSYLVRSPFLEPTPILERCGVHRSDSSREDVMGNRLWKRMFFCGVGDEIDDGLNYAINIINQFYCFFQSLSFFGALGNIFEAFFYYKIFHFMRRLVL